MNTTLKKSIFIAVGVGAVVIIGLVLYNKFKKPVSDTPQGFNTLAERISKSHPEIYAWWENLTISQQIQIENSMTPEVLVILSKGLSGAKISDQAKELLRRAGYNG